MSANTIAPGDLLRQIIANNHTGIYYHLVQAQKMAVGLSPTVADVANVIQMELSAPNADAAFLLKILDVPIQTGNQYSGELYGLQQQTGKSPVRYLFDLLEAEQANSNPFTTGLLRNVSVSSPMQWVMLFIFLVGLYVVVKSLFRFLGRAL